MEEMTLAELLKERDGVDIRPLLFRQTQEVKREPLLYFDDVHLQAVRQGRWKMHLTRYDIAKGSPAPAEGSTNLPLRPVELYDLEIDPDESFDVAAHNPAVVLDLTARAETMLASFPTSIRTAYAETQARATRTSPTGALPERKPS
jgi:arylsulfatase A-like enzyme